MAKPGKAAAAHGSRAAAEAGRILISPSRKSPQAAGAKPSPPRLVPLEKAAAMNGALMTVIGEGQDRSYTTRLAAVQRLPPTLSPEVRMRLARIAGRRLTNDGVIVLGHPHPSWLGYQISPSMIFYQWNDFRETFILSMDALFEASLFVMNIAIEEGIDFMSDSSYGLEMTSPTLFAEMDLPYIQKFAHWTHDRNGLFWYHNCGYTRKLIMDGTFNTMGADVIETIAPPPEGDNDLAESRRFVNPNICTKGNFNLNLLREGAPDQIAEETRKMVRAVHGWKHIFSTADAVLPGTPPENFIAFVKTAREVSE
jgi:hypothetical protein